MASTPISSISSASVDEVAAALGHRGALPALDDVHELEQRHDQAVRVGALRRDDGLEAHDVAVVVGAEDVDELVEAAVQLVPVVGDVGGEVGRLAAGLHERAVLLVARELRGAQPQRALALVGEAVGDQLLARPVPGARRALVERALEEPVVEADAVAVQRLADLRHQDLDAGRGELLGRLLRGAGDLLGHHGDVRALVAVLRRLLAAGAGEDRLAEAADLAAAVVEVVLPLDGVARELEDPGEGVAERGVAAGRGGQRAGRVGGDELHLDPLALLAGAVAVARAEDLARPRPRTRRRRGRG